MNDFSVFFNNRIEYKSDSFSEQTVAFGDWLLTPVRYLFDGNTVQFLTQDGTESIKIEKEYALSEAEKDKPQRNYLRLVGFIVLIAPAIIFGTFVKFLGYLSSTIRELHDRVTVHLKNLEILAEESEELISKINKVSALTGGEEVGHVSRSPQISRQPSLAPKVNLSVQTPSNLTATVSREKFQGEWMVHEYHVDNKPIKARQCVERYSAVEEDIRLCMGMIKFLEQANQLEKFAFYQAQLLNSRERLASANTLFVKAMLKDQKQLMEMVKVETDKTWLNTDSFRDLIRKSFLKGVKKCIFATVNLRRQTLITSEKELELFRVGVISDMRNGWFSLTDFKRMSQAEFKKEVSEIIKKKSNPKKPDEWAQFLIQQTEKPIEKVQEERLWILEKQMLHLVQAVAERSQHKIVLSKESLPSLKLVHVGFLNPKKEKLELGWQHNERVEIEDMHEIFKEFRGKTLVLDGTGPYINGNEVHLPFKISGISKVILQTYFLNISVHGYEENDGVQLAINKESIQAMAQDGNQIFTQEMTDKLNGKVKLARKEKGYPFAIDLTNVLLNHPAVVLSEGCYGGKDRTGYIAEKKMVKNLPAPYANHSSLKDKWNDPTYIPRKIAKDNTYYCDMIKVHLLSNYEGSILDTIGQYGINKFKGHFKRNSHNGIIEEFEEYESKSLSIIPTLEELE